ncbi:MAG TPA: signal peptidase I [Clostridia bacterium]|nr:signal peptidase I [Clostridia bacterium]
MAATRSLLRKVTQVVWLIVLAFTSYLVVSHFFVQSVRVVGRSMAPTLEDSRFYLLNRWVLYVRAPQRTDIVVIRDPQDNGFSVKRVIAAEGDSVVIKDGTVFVNGQKLEESYLPPHTPTFSTPPLNEQSFKCDKDQYFVLGDNRNCSLDSRTYGPIARSKILGLIIH